MFCLTYLGRTVIQDLVGSLAERDSRTVIRESCLGGALVAGLAALVLRKDEVSKIILQLLHRPLVPAVGTTSANSEEESGLAVSRWGNFEYESDALSNIAAPSVCRIIGAGTARRLVALSLRSTCD